MKKIIAFSLALALTLTINACQSKSGSHKGHEPHIHADGSAHYH